jgi:hypothetical protein
MFNVPLPPPVEFETVNVDMVAEPASILNVTKLLVPPKLIVVPAPEPMNVPPLIVNTEVVPELLEFPITSAAFEPSVENEPPVMVNELLGVPVPLDITSPRSPEPAFAYTVVPSVES